MTSNTQPFIPDYAVHPGEILQETLKTKNMTGAELARRCGLTEKHISQIINCIAPVTPETAIQLERVLGISANVWNNLDAQFRLFIAKQSDYKNLEKQKKWADKLPVKELKRRGLLPCGNKTSEIIGGLLDFFGVGNISAWEAQFKKMLISFRHSPSFKSSFESLVVWLRIGEIIAGKIKCNQFNKDTFIASLKEIRSLTHEAPEIFQPKLIDLCSNAGVAVVFVSELPDIHLSGATRWLNPQKAMIILTLRYKRDDHLWFSFFHEAEHILHHKKKAVYIENGELYSGEEEAADRFAENFLVPVNEYRNFIQNKNKISKADILNFSNKLGIAPGIIVGRLQHDEKIPYSQYNELKRKFLLIED